MQKLANWPFHPKKWPFFYGWIIIFSGTLGIIMSIPGQTMGVSTFTDSLIKVLNMSRSELSFAYLCGTLTSATMLTWVGKKYDLYGARPIAVISAVTLGLVLVYLSQIDTIQRLLQHNSYLRSISATVLNFIIMYVGFVVLRFSGQGVLTMVSRNMMMKWFEKRRGYALGFSQVITAMAFAASPVFFDYLIETFDWNVAWQILAVLTGVFFPIYIIIFFRDDPEHSDLKADGDYVESEKEKKNKFPVIRDFTLSEAQKTFGFWAFSFMLAMQALYWTGFTFNIISLFEISGFPKERALSIFLPSSAIAVLVTLSVSSLSDYIRLKYLLYVKGIGACIALLGMIYMSEYYWMIYLLILGNGIMLGLYGVILSVTWPRFYGKTHLGAISGRAITLVVVGSAVGPIVYSESLAYFGSYNPASWMCFVIFVLLTLSAHWANNPQEKLRK